ncbi:MAG: pyridoxamine 5'-phosphate oxidase family protein [Thaumarchaeota archaeon]|nr:pyridoxamine 5'-phosphate oxidase family protein [Nitrososphaerota archaeon]
MRKNIEDFLREHDLCRIATASKDCMPHVVPVSYIFLEGHIYISTDYGTKKLRNLKENSSAALVIDDIKPQRGVLLQGHVKLIENGTKWNRLYGKFYEKFEWAKKDPWKEGEAPFIELNVEKEACWGL